MAYVASEARQELLVEIGEAIHELGVALAALGAAYELVDEQTADSLEEQVFAPTQTAYGRAQRTYNGFAQRFDLTTEAFNPAPEPASRSAADLLEGAAEAARDADEILAELQDSLRPVEVGDAELRAGLAEVRTLLGDVPARVRQVHRLLGR
jgi:hypothetical protein